MIKSTRGTLTKARKQELYEQLRERQAVQGLKPFKRPTLPNSKSEYKNVGEEAQDRQAAS